MKILVISPHMDDEILGMGGAIARHVANGDEVCVVIAAHRIYDRKFDEQANDLEKLSTLKAKEVLGYHELHFLNLPDERLDSCIQEILIPMEDVFMDFKPDVMYAPFYGDNHQDHRAVFDAVRVIARPSGSFKVKKFLLYETPSSTEQSPPLLHQTFIPNYYVNIEPFIDKKIDALHCYEKEKRTFPHPRSEEGLRVLARKRGMEAGFSYAEAFMILRDEWE